MICFHHGSYLKHASNVFCTWNRCANTREIVLIKGVFICLLILCSAALSGCVQQNVQIRNNDSFDSSAVRRIVLLPLLTEGRTATPYEELAVAQTAQLLIRKLPTLDLLYGDNLLRIIANQKETLALESLHDIQKGFNAAIIASICRLYDAHAIMVIEVAVTGFRSKIGFAQSSFTMPGSYYSIPERGVGIELTLLGRDGQTVLWQADGVVNEFQPGTAIGIGNVPSTTDTMIKLLETVIDKYPAAQNKMKQ